MLLRGDFIPSSDGGGGAWRCARNASQLSSTEERGVDTDAPKQRAEQRDEHQSVVETDRQQKHEALKKKEEKKNFGGVAKSLFQTCFRCLHGLEHSSLVFCEYFSVRCNCLFVVDSTSLNERCSNRDTRWSVLSRRFKRVTSIYLVTRRVTGCLG